MPIVHIMLSSPLLLPYSKKVDCLLKGRLQILVLLVRNQQLLLCKPLHELYGASGVIGRRIKLQALLDSVPKLVSTLGPSAEDAHHAAVGITTTDLVSKSAAIEVT